MAANHQLPPIFHSGRQPIIHHRLLETVSPDSQLGLRQRIHHVGRTHSHSHEHELNHVVQPPRHARLDSTALVPATDAIHVVRKHRRDAPPVPRPRARDSTSRFRSTRCAVPVPYDFGHSRIHDTCLYHGVRNIRPSLSPHCPEPPILPACLEYV